jgi:tetratricopeptide (TPR) repeat protein
LTAWSCVASTNWAQITYRDFLTRQTAYQAAPTNATLAWEYARACFDWAEYATNDTQRADIAQVGIAAARRLANQETNLAQAHYYLAMNLGQLARTKTLGALRIVDEMEVLFQRAKRLDEKLDYAGSDRCLGLLYLDAPGWPASLGSRPKARQHLKQAVEIAPTYPENRLNLLEALLRWNDREAITLELPPAIKVIEEGRTTFAGAAWGPSWKDWSPRWEKVLERARRLGVPSAHHRRDSDR